MDYILLFLGILFFFLSIKLILNKTHISNGTLIINLNIILITIIHITNYLKLATNTWDFIKTSLMYTSISSLIILINFLMHKKIYNIDNLKEEAVKSIVLKIIDELNIPFRVVNAVDLLNDSNDEITVYEEMGTTKIDLSNIKDKKIYSEFLRRLKKEVSEAPGDRSSLIPGIISMIICIVYLYMILDFIVK